MVCIAHVQIIQARFEVSYGNLTCMRVLSTCRMGLWYNVVLSLEAPVISHVTESEGVSDLSNTSTTGGAG